MSRRVVKTPAMNLEGFSQSWTVPFSPITGQLTSGKFQKTAPEAQNGYGMPILSQHEKSNLWKAAGEKVCWYHNKKERAFPCVFLPRAEL